MSRTTIIISSFNQWDYLLVAVKSALEVKLDQFHLIVIDDGSKDSEFNKDSLEEFILRLKKDNLVEYLVLRNINNIGLVKSLNYALGFVKTKYVFFLDGDDLIPTDALSKMEELIELNNCDIYGALSSKLAAIDIPLQDYESILNKLKLTGFELFISIAEGLLPFRFSGALIDFQRFKKIGFLDEKYDLYQDRPALLKFAINDFKFGIYNGISYHVRPNPMSSTGGKGIANNRLLNDHIVLFDNFYREYIDYLDSSWINDTAEKLKFIRGFRESKSNLLNVLSYLWINRHFIMMNINIKSLKNFISKEI